MIALTTLSLRIFLLITIQSIGAVSLAEQFKQAGYVEMCNTKHGTATFDVLYTYFDELINFFEKNPSWATKLYIVKERFIRSKNKNYYGTDFFGLYDEQEIKGRNQVAFYYSIHFHEFICSHYPEFNKITAIIRFFEACRDIQQAYGSVFNQAANELGLATIFSSAYGQPPILFKVIKYFPSYVATRPHYDGTVFSLFLDSTDNQALLLSPYKSSFTVDDFYSPNRNFSRGYMQNSIVLIPGTLLTEFSIYPTPHIVSQSDKARYATIAFAMRPNYTPQKIKFAALPNFKN